MQPIDRESGFTLLELVISVTILSLILGIILGALRLGIRSWEVGEERIERLQRERVSYELISEDIKSILPQTGPICPEGKGCNAIKTYFFIGDKERIKFIASNPGLKLSYNQCRIVTYYLEDDPNTGNKVIMMAEQPWLFPDFFRLDEELCGECEDKEYECSIYIHRLYPDVEGLEFSYYGARERGHDPEWDEGKGWNPWEGLCSCSAPDILKTLPQKVKVKITRAKLYEDETDEEVTTEFTVPVMAIMDK